MCGEPLKKGSTACSCGYKESLADRELLRRLARWDRLRTVCSVMLVLGFVAGGVVWWKSGDIRWGLLALFILLAVLLAIGLVAVVGYNAVKVKIKEHRVEKDDE